MKPTYVFIILAFVLHSCASLKQDSTASASTPSIGVLGKQDKSLLSSSFLQVGEPKLKRSIALSISAVPFTKSSFKAYHTAKTKKGERVSVAYVDSLPVKPKFLHFEIKDKIGLKTLLNGTENEEVRSYLTKDDHCQIVSSISMYIDEMEADMYLNAQGLFLMTDTNGMLRIQLVHGKRKQFVNLSKNEIFDYELMGFCWGENVYGKPQIETLNTHGNCPDGTEKNAQKLDDLKSYLKI